MKKYFLACAAMAFAMTSCQQSESQTRPVQTGTDPLRALMDTTVNPSDDFVRYASGAWFKANPIPASRSSNGIFQMVQDSVNKSVREICESNAAKTNNTKGSAEQKIGDFYTSGMDTLAIEKQKLQPIRPLMDAVNNLSDVKSLLDVSARMRRAGSGTMFGMYVGRDDKISTKYAVFLYQGGLGLPDRDYYVEPSLASVRDEYVQHLSRMYRLGGSDSVGAVKSAGDVLQLETTLAKASRRLEDLRDPYANYNKYAVTDLNKLMPDIDWQWYASAFGFNKLDTVVIGQPEYFKELNAQLKKTPIDVWKKYMLFHLLNDFGPYLHNDMDEAVFDFYLGRLSGVKEQKPRWERVVEQTDNSLGQLIGQIYVRDYLPKGTKEKMIEIGNNIMAVYKNRIQNLDWMSDSTKQKALVKLSKVNMKLGYPDKWRDHTELQIDRTSYAGNVMRANAWHYDYMVRKYGKPVNPDEWEMTPQTYNAYYNPTGNEIVIPGSNIIVPGFQGLPDDAVLYAIIGGSTFGHEITHGFDDQGAKYDENGNLRNWWSKEDSIRFAQRANALVEQFNTYTVNDSLHVRGQATLGENIADLGGIVMGYEAFKKTDQYKNNVIIGGLTPDQRFFLGYAYAWMVNVTPQKAAQRIMTDVHAPPQYRVIGPIVNMSEFYKTFNIQNTSKYYRDSTSRVMIW